MLIAIDGYSACGKSTLAKGLAKNLGYLYIDTGAMYRAVTLHLWRKKIDLAGIDLIAREVATLEVGFAEQDGSWVTTLNGEPVESQIRAMEISQRVSAVAALTPVRKVMVDQQRRLAREGSAVLDGRDIGTVVFPDAPLKIFLVASLEVRVERRYLELRKRTDRETVRQNLLDRDHTDSHRADSPLRQAPDAVVVDNTNLDPNEQLAMCLALAKERLKTEHPSG